MAYIDISDYICELSDEEIEQEYKKRQRKKSGGQENLENIDALTEIEIAEIFTQAADFLNINGKLLLSARLDEIKNNFF